MCGLRENYPVLRGGSSLVACSDGRAVQTGRGGGAGPQPRGPAGAGRASRHVEAAGGTLTRGERRGGLARGRQLVRRNAPMAAMESSCVVIV